MDTSEKIYTFVYWVFFKTRKLMRSCYCFTLLGAQMEDYSNLYTPIGIILLIIGIGLVLFLRSYDKTFKHPLLHYILFFVGIFPTYLLCEVFSHESYGVTGDLILLAISIIFGIITICGGWGVRQCGMDQGMYHKNVNRIIGEFFLFFTYLCLITVFWRTALGPLIYWSGDLEYHGGGFWRFTIALIILYYAMKYIIVGWTAYLIPTIFKTAGKYTLYLITISFGYAFIRIWWNWSYANFNGLSFLILLFIGSLIIIGLFYVAICIIAETRCPRCHNCDGKETDRIDQGYSHSTSIRHENISDSSINPHHSGAIVTDARRKILTTIVYHNWKTVHTCQICGYKWSIDHSKEVGHNSRELGRDWTETYKK